MCQARVTFGSAGASGERGHNGLSSRKREGDWCGALGRTFAEPLAGAPAYGAVKIAAIVDGLKSTPVVRLNSPQV
jgi:hypothetical protein